MSGFDNANVDVEFFSGTAVKSNFLINIGHGDPVKLFPRSPKVQGLRKGRRFSLRARSVSGYSLQSNLTGRAFCKRNGDKFVRTKTTDWLIARSPGL